jgi:hypothetical protein
MTLQHQDSSSVLQYNGNSLRGDDRKETPSTFVILLVSMGNKQRKSLLRSRHIENMDISELRITDKKMIPATNHRIQTFGQRLEKTHISR